MSRWAPSIVSATRAEAWRKWAAALSWCGAAAFASPAAAQVPRWQGLLPICSSCHGADGHALPPGVPHLAGQPRLFIENRLVMMREGLSVPPAHPTALLDGLLDADLVALSTHFASQPRSPQRPARDANRAARGQAVSQRALCGSCHLPDYRGREQMPRLAGQREDYLLTSMRQFAAGQTAGRDTLMSNALIGLTDADLSDLAHHLATIPAP
jgi:cytochrome c553